MYARIGCSSTETPGAELAQGRSCLPTSYSQTALTFCCYDLENLARRQYKARAREQSVAQGLGCNVDRETRGICELLSGSFGGYIMVDLFFIKDQHEIRLQELKAQQIGLKQAHARLLESLQSTEELEV